MNWSWKRESDTATAISWQNIGPPRPRCQWGPPFHANLPRNFSCCTKWEEIRAKCDSIGVMRLWKSEKVPEKRAADVFPFYEKPGRGRRRRRKQRRLKMLLRLRLLIWRSICQIKLTFLSRGKVGRIFKARPIRKSLRQIAPVFFSFSFRLFFWLNPASFSGTNSCLYFAFFLVVGLFPSISLCKSTLRGKLSVAFLDSEMGKQTRSSFRLFGRSARQEMKWTKLVETRGSFCS